MLISQLYRGNYDLNDKGYQILQAWYNQTNDDKQRNIEWLANELRANAPGKAIAIQLALRLRVPISSNFPPP
jgi:hypothetical protein